MDSVYVRVVGAEQALKALSILEPEVAKRTKREISDIGKMMAQYMTGLVASSGRADTPPVSGWQGTPAWPSWGAVTGSSVRRGASVIITPKSGADARIAAMYEYIGNATSIQSENGAKLSQMFNSRLGQGVANSRRKRPGRLVRQTLNETYGDAFKRLKEACDEAVATVNRRMP